MNNYDRAVTVADVDTDALARLAAQVPGATTSTDAASAVRDADVVVLAVPSGAERVQQAAPRARVVKAFNTVFAGNQASAVVDGIQLDGFVAGDDDQAKTVVSSLLDEIGFRSLDVGALSAARHLEGLAFLNIAHNARNDLPWQSAWKLVGRAA